MSNMEKISDQIGRLEKESEEDREWLRGLGYKPHSTVIFSEKSDHNRHEKFLSNEREITRLREKYISLMLSSISQSSQSMNESSRRLEDTTNRLNRATLLLLFATLVLMGIAIGDYLFKYILRLD